MAPMKRALAATALAVALSVGIAAPAFGQAYGGSPGLDCTDAVVVGDHFPPNSSPTVYVDGEPVGNADVDEDGTFTFPLPDSLEPGAYTVTVAGTTVSVVCVVEEEVLGTTVQPPGPDEGTGGGIAGEAGDEVGGTVFAFTGANVALLASVATALLAIGLLAVTIGRRRERAAIRGGGDDSRT